mmetsp:Transcript_28610/g.58170  ORF Transcript_28610/g.58170 Transcript_28610/m.58170 type:complete len:667 (-) Transcript_28610:73-2073(-)
MCKEGSRICSSRASPQVKSYNNNGKKKNKQCCGNYGYGRAPVLREPWRTAADAKHPLGAAGHQQLQGYLEETIRVVPQSGSPELPDLIVSPTELIRHILARQSAMIGDHKSAANIFVEVYGGVAQAVVSVDIGLAQWTTPTDIDARFYVTRTGNDGWDFDRCRYFVEEYLLMKLQLASPADSELRYATPNVVRHRYYQKQVVIGGAFSLLSIGDPTTGKAIDLEFAIAGDGSRKYFDDANSFVIPLTLQQLAGMSAAVALSMTGSFEHAVDLTARKELLIQQPAQVVNGLALYVHAVTTKLLTVASVACEDACARELVRSFLDTSHSLCARFDDPLRFLRSFLRSHYAARPLSAAVSVAQLCAELAAYKDDMPPPAEGTMHRTGQMDLDWLVGELLADVLLAAMAPTEEAKQTVLAVAAYARSPGGAGSDDDRGVLVEAEDGRGVRLLRKVQGCAAAAVTCAVAADCLEKRLAGSSSEWLHTAVHDACIELRRSPQEAVEVESANGPEETVDHTLEEAEADDDGEETSDEVDAVYMSEATDSARESEDEEVARQVFEAKHRGGEAVGREKTAEGWVGDHECRKEVKVVRREDDDDQGEQPVAHRQSKERGLATGKLPPCSCRLESMRVGPSGAAQLAYPLQPSSAALPPSEEVLRLVPQLVRVQAG